MHVGQTPRLDYNPILGTTGLHRRTDTDVKQKKNTKLRTSLCGRIDVGCPRLGLARSHEIPRSLGKLINESFGLHASALPVCITLGNGLRL